MKKLTVEFIHHGEQLKPYGPGVNEAIIEIEFYIQLDEIKQQYWVKHYFQKVVGTYYDEDNPPPDPFCHELKKFEKLADNKWLIRTERRYND